MSLRCVAAAVYRGNRNGSIRFRHAEKGSIISIRFRHVETDRRSILSIRPTLEHNHKAASRKPHRHAAAAAATVRLQSQQTPPTNERMNSIDGELIRAARENNQPEVSRLLSDGAHVNARNKYRETPLHWACLYGNVQVVVELLEHGADIEAKNNEGSTPLHYAALNGHLAVVKALLSSGANILAANNVGRVPIHYAVSEGKSEVSKYLLREFYATIRRLPLHELLEDLTWIGDANIRVGVPPLRYAHHRTVLGTDDVVEIVEYLVSRNPEMLSSRDRDGSLPLHVACRRGASFAIVQSLVNLYKASVKTVTPQGDLPLFLACEMPEPSLDTIFLLMKMYPDLVYR
jgi:ankyrin repeat protein